MKERPILFASAMIRALLEGRKTQTRRIIKPQPPSIDAVRAKTGDSYHLFRDTVRPGDVWRVAGGVSVVKELCGQSEWRCPYGQPGDRLWVKETWRVSSSGRHYPSGRSHIFVTWREQETSHCHPRGSQHQKHWDLNDAEHDALMMRAYGSRGFDAWRPSIHMPRWASRLTLEVMEVRVQRLQEISDADAIAEGARRFDSLPSIHPYGQDPRWSMESPSSTAECLGTPRMAFAAYLAKIHGPSAWEDNLWAWAVSFKVVEL